MPELPSDHAARRPTPDDAAALLDLVVSIETAAVGESDTTNTEVVAFLDTPGYDRERGGWVVEHDGAVVGWLWTELDEDKGEVFVDPYASTPELLEWLLREGLAYATELAAERPGLVARAGSYLHDEAMRRLLEDTGFVVRRAWWRMRLDLGAGAPTTDPVPPAGVAVRRAEDTDADRRLMHRLHQESFRDHITPAPRDYDAWLGQLAAQAGRDPSQWWLASVDGTMVGVLIGDDAEAERGVSMVRTLGVLPAGRGRGVAKALLRTAFAEAARRSRTTVALFVDSESLTGATRVYESVGMTVDKVLLAWSRPLP